MILSWFLWVVRVLILLCSLPRDVSDNNITVIDVAAFNPLRILASLYESLGRVAIFIYVSCVSSAICVHPWLLRCLRMCSQATHFSVMCTLIKLRHFAFLEHAHAFCTGCFQ